MRLSVPNRLLLSAGTLVAGEACGFAMRGAAVLWPWLAFVFGLSLLAAFGWGARRLLLPCIFAVGIVLAARTESARLQVLNETQFVSSPPPVTVRVESAPQRWRMKNRRGESVDFLSHIGPLPVKVVILQNESSPAPAMGETWVCTGRLTCKHHGDGRADRFTLWVSSPEKARRVGTARLPAAAWYARLSKKLAEQVSLGLGWTPETASLNRAILLGQRSGLSRKRRDMLAAAGTIHVFAISGLHVMVIALALNRLLARLDVQAQARGLIALPTISAYVMLTGMRPSAVRAAMMLAVYLLAPAFGCRPNARTAWSVTAITVYGISPERLFDLGCALSFAVMFGIVVWVEWTRKFATPVAPGTKLQLFFGGLGVSFAAWVAGVPITAHAFGQFSVGGLLANVAVIFCASYMVRWGMFGLAASFFCLPLAALANNLAALLTMAMEHISELVASLPFARVLTPSWTVWHSLAWYAAWIAACLAVGRFFPRKSAPSPWWL